MGKNLFHPVDTNSKRGSKHEEHGTSIKLLIGSEGMRVIGQAYDKGIVKS